MSASDKFQVTTNPSLPSQCLSCGRHADGKLSFVDFGVSLDYVGAILFCIDCAKEMGRTIDMVDRTVLDETVKLAESLRAEKERVANERDKYRDCLDSVVGLRHLLGVPLEVLLDNSSESSEADRSVGEAERDLVGAEPKFA